MRFRGPQGQNGLEIVERQGLAFAGQEARVTEHARWGELRSPLQAGGPRYWTRAVGASQARRLEILKGTGELRSPL